MNALRRQVETIVRPIRASERRKDRFREELLAHLEAAVAAQTRELGEEEAVRQALARLGPADEVRRALAATVPGWERLLWLRLTSLEPFVRRWNECWGRESPIHFALRFTGMYVAMTLSVFFLTLLPGVIRDHLRGVHHWADVGRLLLLIYAPTGVDVFLFAYAVRRARRALYGEDGWRQSRLAAGAWALLPGVGVALDGAAVIHWWRWLDRLGPPYPVFGPGFTAVIAAAAVLVPIVTAFCAVRTAAEKRHYLEWDGLELDG